MKKQVGIVPPPRQRSKQEQLSICKYGTDNVFIDVTNSDIMYIA